MSLINQTYFVGEINIPVKTYGNIDTFISRYEREILIKLFGYTLYKLISAYSSTNPSASPQRIRDIIEGKEFELDGFIYKWNGLINPEKESIIAYYVYYHYVRSQQSHTSTTGETKDNHENANNVEVFPKIQYAWNKMLRLIGDQSLDIPDMSMKYEYNEYFNSLMFFMMQNYSDYPEWQWQIIESVNAFDL